MLLVQPLEQLPSLTAQLQPVARGDEHLELRRDADPLEQQITMRRELLEVIQNQDARFTELERFEDLRVCFIRCELDQLAQPERLTERAPELLPGLEVFELADDDTSLGVLLEPPRAQPGFTCSGGAKQCHERVRPIEQLRQSLEVIVSADEGVGLIEP